MINVEGLTRRFEVTEREPGLRSALRSVVHRTYRTVTAVDDVTFSLAAGEIVGFLGPNGSGKTTTLKCLAGLLTPSDGTVTVLGHTPHLRERDFLRRLGFVMGQRWQLNIDLPVMESFELHRIIYDLDSAQYRRTRDDLVDLLDLGELAGQITRKLSLGQRMRCEFAAALLHRPDVVLLDEPTLGLDFDAQQQIRSFVTSYVELTGAAVLLTSHYLADIEALCQRVMTISKGRITYTGSLRNLVTMAGDAKWVTAQLSQPISVAGAAALGVVLEHTGSTLVVEVPRARAGDVVSALTVLTGVINVSLTDPPLEDTLRELYALAP